MRDFLGLQGPAAWLSIPVAEAYRTAISLRNRGYDAVPTRSQQVPFPVVSVGNLQVGGTGKTPLTNWIRCRFEESGYTPTIVMRGYGGNGTTQPVTDASTAEQVGDEAMLHHQSGAQVIVGRSRIDAIRQHVQPDDRRVILLDDGFQHRQLARDVDIIVWRTHPQGRLAMLPRGVLREPLSSVERATHLAVHGSLDALPAELRNSTLPRFSFRYGPPQFSTLNGDVVTTEKMASEGYACIAAIAQTKPFFESVRRAVAEAPTFARGYGDHHVFDEKDLKNLTKLCKRNGVRWLVMTTKDAVRWPHQSALSEVVTPVVARASFLADDQDDAGRWFDSILEVVSNK